MGEKILAILLPRLVEAIIGFLTEEKVKRFLDGLLDKLEDKVVEEADPYDASAILILKALREVFDIDEFEDDGSDY